MHISIRVLDVKTWRSIGHVLCRQPTNISKCAFSWAQQGKKRAVLNRPKVGLHRQNIGLSTLPGSIRTSRLAKDRQEENDFVMPYVPLGDLKFDDDDMT